MEASSDMSTDLEEVRTLSSDESASKNKCLKSNKIFSEDSGAERSGYSLSDPMF